MASNFDFLKPLFSELAELGEMAERNLYIDPDTSTYKMFKLAEQIVNYIVKEEKGADSASGATASENISYLKRSGLIPTQVDDILYYLRITRNLYAHGVRVGEKKYGSKEREIQDCLARLEMAHTLAGWFMQTYGDWRIDVPPFCAPPKIAAVSESDAISIQKESRLIAAKLKATEAQNKTLVNEAKAKDAKLAQVKSRLYEEESARKRAEFSLATQSELLEQAKRVAQKAEIEKSKALTEKRQTESILTEERARAKREHESYLHAAKMSAEKQAALDRMHDQLQQAEKLAENLGVPAHAQPQQITLSAKKYCPCCLSETNSDGKCLQCGKTGSKVPQALPANTLILDRYVIGNVIWYDSHQFVYQALDTKLNRRVSIKEFFPRVDVKRGDNAFDVISRNPNNDDKLWSARRNLVLQGQLLAQMNGTSGIATVYDVFEANETAYIVFQRVDSGLEAYIKTSIGTWSYRSFLQASRTLYAALDTLDQMQISYGTITANDVVISQGQFLLLGLGMPAANNANGGLNSIRALLLEIIKSLPLTEFQRGEIEKASQHQYTRIADYYRRLIELRDSFAAEDRDDSSCILPEDKVLALTPQQDRAVKTTARQVVVVAGPGSGKTRVITERICYLTNELNIPAREILALSFTAKAANEMRKRISGRIHQGASGMNVRTFHSFGLQVLRTHGDLLGYQDDFGIISNTAKNKYLRDILGKLGIEGRELSAYAYAVSKAKNGLPNDEYTPRRFEEVFARYEDKLREANLVDLDDMLHKALLLLNDPQVKSHYSGLYSHVMVDEFQDVNLPQIHMLKAIVGSNTNTFLVGDDDQCIYEWRGSKPRYITAYANAGDRVELIKLEDNYRSEGSIVSLSSDFIQHNKNRIAKSMTPKRNTSVPRITNTNAAKFLRFSSEDHQARFFAREIDRLTDQYAYSKGDFAILVRSSKQADVIKDALADANIPYIDQQSGETGYDSFIQVLHTIRKLDQKGNLARAVNFPTRAMDHILFAELKEKYDISEMSTPEAFCYLFGSNESFEDSDLFRARYRLLSDLHSRYEAMDVTTIIEELLNYYSSERCAGTNEARNKISFVHHLLEIAAEFENAQTNDSLSSNLDEFLDYLEMSLQDDHSAEHFNSAVNIMTCHKAKGLEFPVVFIPGVQLGVFPNDFFIRTEAQLEEERRLFYVTMTRAMDHLYVTCYDDPLFNPRPGSVVTKGFIAEIPSIILEQR